VRLKGYYQQHKLEFAARAAVQEAIQRGEKFLRGKLHRHPRQGEDALSCIGLFNLRKSTPKTVPASRQWLHSSALV